LRTYHDIGTPQLIFPKPDPLSGELISPQRKLRTQSIDQSSLSHSPNKARGYQIPVPSPSRQTASEQSGSSIGISRPSTGGSADSDPQISYEGSEAGEGVKFQPGKKNSNLSPLSLARDDDNYPLRFVRGEEEADKDGGQSWSEQLGGSRAHIPKSVSARGARREGWSDSPLEMVDRSRPW
jgi:hypothetical protein